MACGAPTGKVGLSQISDSVKSSKHGALDRPSVTRMRGCNAGDDRAPATAIREAAWSGDHP